jgi:hypothetical protein
VFFAIIIAVVSRLVLEKLVVAQLVKFPAIYGTWLFIVVLPRAVTGPVSMPYIISKFLILAVFVIFYMPKKNVSVNL